MAGDLTLGIQIKADTSRSYAPEDVEWLRRRLYYLRLQPASRTCLGLLCRGRRVFNSSHAGNRICERCKQHSNALFGAFDDSLPGDPS